MDGGVVVLVAVHFRQWRSIVSEALRRGEDWIQVRQLSTDRCGIFQIQIIMIVEK